MYSLSSVEKTCMVKMQFNISHLGCRFKEIDNMLINRQFYKLSQTVKVFHKTYQIYIDLIHTFLTPFSLGTIDSRVYTMTAPE